MDIIIPSYLFSAISLLLMGYNTRYLALSKLIRDFYKNNEITKKDIENIPLFRKRLGYIKKLQMFSLYSLIFSVLSTFLILLNCSFQRETFALALILFMLSLYYSLREVLLSTKHI